MKVLGLKIESIKISENFEQNLNQIIPVLIKNGIAGVSIENDKKSILADLVKNIIAVDIPINDLFESVVLCGIESHRNELHVFLRILNLEKQDNNDDTSDIDTSKLS